MTDHKSNFILRPGRRGSNRRQFLKEAALAGLLISAPNAEVEKILAVQKNIRSNNRRPHIEYPTWIVEARIYGLGIYGARVDVRRMKNELDRAVNQGANVIEADSNLSAYLSEEEFAVELNLIRETTSLIHDAGMKVLWYVPGLEIVTPNGQVRSDSFAKTHSDWLQLSFDRKRRAVFYVRNRFRMKSKDESAWVCPNSPYREWFKDRLRQLTQTGIDGLWIDTIMFSPFFAGWGCADKYCRDKFTLQTGFEFPQTFDLSDRSFWRYVQWRHDTLTEFIEGCREIITLINPDTVTMAEVATSDHLGATQYGTEGSSMENNFVVWKVEPISDTTAMAEAGYDDWLILHGIYQYCRGATMERPSWAFCYGYNDDDAQLVMASAIAAQNNPYELRIPQMTTTVGMEFRGMMYRWIAKYSRQIYRSKSIAPVAVLFSERNRDFVDACHGGGVFIGTAPPGRDRHWRATKEESPLNMEYMGDYRGLSLFLYQHQIPADIYPISRMDANMLQQYQALVLPYMAILTQNEKELLLQAVRQGATLIVSGSQPGLWDVDGDARKQSFWGNVLDNVQNDHISHNLGKGRLHFWKRLIGRDYLRHRDDQKITSFLLSWLNQAGVQPWINRKAPVVIQPYILEKQIIIHLLNYSQIGEINHESRRLPLELIVPWDFNKGIVKITQSEPSWNKPRKLVVLEKENEITIPINIGRNALVIIDMK